MILAIYKPVVLPQASGNKKWASGLVVIFSPKASKKPSKFLTDFSKSFFFLFFKFSFLLEKIFKNLYSLKLTHLIKVEGVKLRNEIHWKEEKRLKI